MENERTPPDLREGVRSGIFASLKHDVERRGGRTARLLGAAGLVGVVSAVGMILLIGRHPFDHHAPWHVVVFSAVWTGLLVVSLAISFLQVRTPTLPLAHAASVGLLGLGLAGICGALCPDQHFLHWWSSTAVGAQVTQTGGLALSALCFGLVTTLVVSTVSAFLMLGDRTRPVRSLIPATMLLALLVPGIALQSVGTSFGAFVGWLAGAAAGAYAGIAGGKRARELFFRT